MTEGYRQKILNWLSSITIVLLATVLSVAHYWFRRMPEQFGYGERDFSFVAGALGETLSVYVMLAPIVLIWHFFDFIEKFRPRPGNGSRLTTYGTFLMVMMICISLFSLMVLGFWQYNSCDELEGVFYFECVVGPSPWLMIPWLVTMTLALFLCLAKAAYAIRSLLTET